ncbi:hypothetical protein MINT15_00780 [Saccharomonospora viridis]|uniref:Uncharacterized protein n=1 Tax=Saccharomonospora viridis TaxID=1852 RepID=A0A837DDX1_9PSEU|nr:hypothetical protein MINT15_00780 [Saccharomonospora viridis]
MRPWRPPPAGPPTTVAATASTVTSDFVRQPGGQLGVVKYRA